MTRYLLDTNTVSYIVRGKPEGVLQKLLHARPENLAISAVTKGELYYGLARAGNGTALRLLIGNFLQHVEVLPWDTFVAQVYGEFRARIVAKGFSLGALDTMIAAHAVATNRILVSHDQAFQRVAYSGLTVEDWAT